MGSRFLDEALKLAGVIRAEGQEAADGSVHWYAPASSREGLTRAPLGPAIYAGSCGIALFLAALYRVTGEAADKQLCLQGLQPFLQGIDRLAAAPERASKVQHSIGGLAGLGSMVYALVRIGELLREPDLYRSASVLALLIEPGRIARDEQLDVMGGSAGAILALLSVESQIAAAGLDAGGLLRSAEACGLHLLETHLAITRSLGGPTSGRKAGTTGFCHGTSGIACALDALGARIEDPALLAAAAKIKQAERDALPPETNTTDRHVVSWCKGVAGRLLARLRGSAAPRALQAPEEVIEIEGWAEQLHHYPISDIDDVCCGNFGRVDALLQASKQLADQSFADAAAGLADQVVNRADLRGGFVLALRPPSLTDLRYFNGISGIGYTLLRLTSQSGLPCVVGMA